MDRLDELEAQSVFILREAFARLKRVCLLWSLGKDSNAMIWLARKAFFGRVPFPVMHVDSGKKFPEMYAFRERYAQEWQLDLLVEPCPPIEVVDPTLPPAARSAARKTEGLKLALGKHGFDGLIAGIRRDEEATRAKERVFSPRGAEGIWDVRDQPPEFWNPGLTCAYIRSCIGPSATSGPIRSASGSRSFRSTFPAMASATARSATPTSRFRSPRMPVRLTKSSSNST